jgi:hypothetical protein
MVEPVWRGQSAHVISTLRRMTVRLKPPVSQEEAYRYLCQSAVLGWGVQATAKMEPTLSAIAKSMAVVSALDVPDDVEPLFGENIDIDLLEAGI